MSATPLEQFALAIRAAGITPPVEIIADGELHRFASDGTRGDDAGWYVLHEDGVPAGAFGDWRTGVNETWCGNVDRRLSAAEEARRRERIEKAQSDQEALRTRWHEEAAAYARQVWEQAQPATGDNPYLKRKGVQPHGIRERHDRLVIPIRDGVRLTSLQFIPPDGKKKRFLKRGAVHGGYYSIGKANGTICITEGFATGATVYETTGHAVAVAFNAGNLEVVTRQMQSLFPNAKLIVCADDDFLTPGNPGLTKAVEAARSTGALIAVPDFGADRPEDATDFNDLHRHRGADAVRQCVENGQAPADDEAGNEPQENAATLASREIERIAALPPFEYERNRTEVAKRLGVRTTALDRLAAKARENIEKRKTTAMMFGEVEHWGQPVNGEKLLAELGATFERFVVLPRYASTALALWTVMTYGHDQFQHSPLLLARSATKRCGKSTLVSLLAELAHRPMPASNLTPAVIFRVVEEFHPTLLIDEVDSFLEVSEEMRGILNSGHQRGTAIVYRIEEVEGRRQTIGFSTWSPKLLAMIGRPPSTILDRSITIHMERKLRGDKVEKRRHAALNAEGLKSRCARWAADNAIALAEARPAIPDELNDRQSDSWEPLLAIADRAGPACGTLAREAAVGLCGADKVDLDQAELGEELLRDIRNLFDDKARRKLAGELVEDLDRMSGSDMVNALLAQDARPWGEANKGRPMTQNWLARRLSTFRIGVKNVRFSGARVLKGYQVEQFEDAWSRYLSV